MEFKNSFIHILIIMTEVDHIMYLAFFCLYSLDLLCSQDPPVKGLTLKVHGEVMELSQLNRRKLGHQGCE